MATKVNWGAKHGPVWGSLNAALGAAVFVLFTDIFGTPPVAGIIVGLLIGVCAYGSSRHAKLHRQSAAWRGGAWVLMGAWTAWARVHETSVAVPVAGVHEFWWANGGNWVILFAMFLLAAVGGKWLAHRPEDPADAHARAVRKQQLELAKRYNGRDGSPKSVLADEWEMRFARVQNIGTLKKVMVIDQAATDAKPNAKAPVQVPLIDPRTKKPVVQVIGGVEIFHLEFWTDDADQETKTYNPRKKVWENDGFTFKAMLPEGGYGWRDLDGKRMADDARLPSGCTVRFTEGDDRGSFVGYVQLVNVLAKDRPYPTDFSAKSVLEGVHIGYEEHGRPKMLDMEGHNTTNSGAPKGGKTNCANVIGMRLVETLDTIIFDYDIAGGGISAPFFPEAWLSGDYATAPEPGVAAAAPNVELAWALSMVGVKLNGGRKAGYQSLKRDGKVPLGHCLDKACRCGGKGIPLVMHRVDEGWSLYKAGEVGAMVRANLESVAGEGRPARQRVFFGALGSTDEYIPLGVQNLAPNRIALKQPNSTEISRFLGWGKSFDEDIFRQAGNAAVRDADENLDVVKILLLSDEDTIRDGVLKCSKRRPVLDPVSEKVANGPITTDHPQLVAYFTGKIDVAVNGRANKNDPDKFIPDGTITITNFWKNRWLYALPVMFPDRFPNLMQDAMAACGQGPGQEQLPAPATQLNSPAPAEPSTGGTTMTAPAPMSTAAALRDMKDAGFDLEEAMAAGEAAAAAADARYAARQTEEDDIAAALSHERGSRSTVTDDSMPDPDCVVVPDTVSQMWRDTEPDQQPARPAVARQNAAPRFADDPELQRILILGYIVEAGADGISIGPLRARLMEEVTDLDGGEQYGVTDQAMRKSRMTQLTTRAMIRQPFLAADEDLLAPDGGKKSHWVATDLGVRFWEKNRGKVGK